MENNVLITGLGAVSSAGNNLSDTLDSFRNCKRNAGRVKLFNMPFQYPVFEVKQIPEKFYFVRTEGI
jgi:hypothetical protein